jgi:IrrE N-terminal-like domain
MSKQQRSVKQKNDVWLGNTSSTGSKGKAQGLRSACGVSTFGRLDPFELARVLNVELFMPADVGALDRDSLNQLTVVDPTAWSAGLLHGPDGRKLIVLNPTHSPNRQRASLMEELAHLSLNHEPARLLSYDGVIVRTWNKTQETEAYWVGAAALLPRRVIKGALTLGRDAAAIADEHMVSVELVHFREKVLGIRLPVAGP